ncbi:MAG: asparagine synthase (glutamine-hydrolyzing), partial [Balneolaceae bacterium]|nr:asparagine synthase (glutamine-hydrolyzing) [Balneolaceae bacterium]
MCGIAGYIQSSGRVSKTEIVSNMLAKLTHRGPDDQGLWRYKNVSLGYTRLSILDTTENGNQPFITNDGKGVLCYNGEVYNFQVIRKKLIKERVQFKSRCDTEVVLYALHIWGPKKAVSMFNGMFAFAYHNLRTDTLWLGRDSAGIKPLYLSTQNGNTIFASEIKALFEHPSIECRPDMHTVGNYLKNSKLARSTPFEKITEMQPGTLLQIQAGDVSEYTFFDVEQNLDVERILDKQHSSAEGLMSELEHIVRASVNSHMISDVPIAAMCSGGVDSSLMAAFACQHKQDLVGYVADVEGVKISEKERAEQIADHLNIELRTVPVKRRDFLRLWPYAAYHNDEPIYFKQNMLHLAVAERVQKDGFKILLCGEGADELFGGYHWQASVHDMWKIRRKKSELIPDNRLTRFLMRFLPTHHPLDLDQLQKEPFRYLSPDPPIGNIPSQNIIFIEEAKKQLLRKSFMNKLEPLKNIEDRAYLTR